MNKIKPWQKALAGALLAAGLVSACGGAPAAESTPAPSYPDNSTTNDYEADTTDYYDDEDYDLEESAYYATPNLEVGATLTAEEAEAAREALRGMDNEERAGRVVINRGGGYIVANAGDLEVGDRLDTATSGGINKDANFIWRETGNLNFWYSPDGSQVYVMDINSPLTDDMRNDIAWAASNASGSRVPQEVIDQQTLVSFSIYEHSGPHFMITARPMDGQTVYEILWTGHHGLPGFDAAREAIRGASAATSEAQALRNFQPLFNAFPNSPIFGVNGQNIRG